jgi:hypothetical protein
MNCNSSAFLTTFDLTESQMAEFIVVHSVKVATEFVPETFGRLTTLGPKFRLPVGNKGKYESLQVCECSCRKTVIVAARSLGAGSSQSCGCLQKERVSQSNTIHGMRQSPEYSSYQNMKDRCMNHNNPEYHNYGGRGIRVCDRWREPNGQGFLNFLSDMGTKPFENLTVERKLVNGNYCPENCCWATNTEQARNRRSNLNLTHDGKTQCLAAWAEELGIPRSTLKNRLQGGWSIEEALTNPVHKSKQRTKP